MPKLFTPLIVCLANNPQSSLGFLQLSNRLLALGHPYSSKSTCRMFSFFNRSFSIWPPLKATTFSSVVHSAQLRLNNQEVIDRLTQLLNSPHLEQQLNQIRTTIRTVVARRGKGKTIIFFSFFFSFLSMCSPRLSSFCASSYGCVRRRACRSLLSSWRWGPSDRLICGLPIRRRGDSVHPFTALFCQHVTLDS